MKKLLALLTTLSLTIALITLTACSSAANVSQTSTLEDFSGQTSVVVFGGTYCSHCKTTIPKLESQIWDEYKKQINLWIQVVDGESGATFNTSMPQGYNANLTFEGLAGRSCGYVPSWVVLNANGEAIESSCGTEKNLDDMVSAIEEML